VPIRRGDRRRCLMTPRRAAPRRSASTTFDDRSTVIVTDIQ